MKFLVIFLAVFLVCEAFDEETKKAGEAAVKVLLKKCQEEEGATEKDMKRMKEGSLPNTPEGKCLAACFSKEINLIEEDGSLSQETFKIIFDSVLENEGFEVKSAVKRISATCKGPFDEEDTCENAYLMWKCFADEKEEIESLYL